MRRFPYNLRLVLLVFFMILLWLASGIRVRPGQDGAWNTVRHGQQALWRTQLEAGVPLSSEDDKLRTGFIGVEWSQLTTTLGSIEAKRTSANPLWTAQFFDWFDELELRAGDRVVIYSSSSFPAMLFSAIVAAESRQLEILLSVSLGSSAWGANRTEFFCPMMLRTLLEGGYLSTRPAFYTLGGSAESGRDFSPEVLELLEEISRAEGTPLVVPETLEKAIEYKAQKLIEYRPKLFISIGGSNANLGNSADAAEIPNGLLLPGGAKTRPIGAGVIAAALSAGVPTLNILNIKKLAIESGIPWDADLFVKARYKLNPWLALIGLSAYFAVLFTHKRWIWQDEHRE